ncbi:GvpL/GvpF family gas vesicle protein [Frankia sp. CcWB3]
MSTTAGAEDLTALARRLAPEIVEEAVREARELARHQIVECLAREITRVVMEGIRPAVTPPRDLPPVPVSQSGSVSRSESVPESVPESTVETVGAVGPGVRPSSRASRTDRGLYAYGIIPAASDTAGIEGLGAGTEVDAIACGPLSLAVSEVELSLLRDLEEDVSDTGRLAVLARRHDQVLWELLERGGVLPLRFGTVLADPEQARAILDDQVRDLLRMLDAVRDAREWGFRVDSPVHHPAETVPTVGVGGRAGSATGSGTAYLAERRRELQAERDRRDEIAAMVDRADRELAAHTRDDARRHTGRPGRMFDCAYLVPRSEEEAFLTTATVLTRELDAAGCPAEVTGPWPPYSFVHITLGGDQRLGGTFDGHEDSPGGGAPVVDRVRTTDRVRTADRVQGPAGGRNGAIGGRHGGGDD